jgi:DNA-binding protein
VVEERKLRGRDMKENVVIVGRKPAMNYVLACLTLFHQGFSEVTIRARGRAISKAVDVANIVKEKFIPTAKVKSLELGNERIVTEKGDVVNLSIIAITLTKE